MYQIRVIVTFMLLGFSASIFSSEDESLFNRLGKEQGVVQMVNVLVDLMASNPTLAKNTHITNGLSAGNLSTIKFHLANFICEKTGGDCRYTGRDMTSSHQHLKITRTEWKAFLDDFGRTANLLRVDPRDARELSAYLATLKDAVLSGD